MAAEGEMKDGICNAIITATTLGVEEHGIMTSFLYVDYGGVSQGFGGYTLDAPPGYAGVASTRQAHRAFGCWVKRVLDITGAEKWEDVKGRVIRVQIKNHLSVAIGHFLRDDWFYPEEELALTESK
jgi:hypothetical protein